MDPEYRQFVLYGEEDVDPAAPQLSLELSLEVNEVYRTRPFRLDWQIKKAANSSNPDLPFFLDMWLHRDALERGQLVLLHLTEAGPKKINVSPLSYIPPKRKPPSLEPWEAWEFQGTDMLQRLLHLTPNYQMHLIPGEKYALLWPGLIISYWSWGSFAYHLISGKGVMNHDNDDGPKCILPASKSSIVTFRVTEEPMPWPGRLETKTDVEFEQANRHEYSWGDFLFRTGIYPPTPPRKPSDRLPGVPVLTMTISGPSEWRVTEHFDVTITVTYPSDAVENVKPISFLNECFRQGDYGLGQNCIALYRLVRDDSTGMEEWKRYKSSYRFDLGAPRPPPPPPRPLRGTTNAIPSPNSMDIEGPTAITTLRPGESWTIKRRLHSSDSPYLGGNRPLEDAQPGTGRFMCIFKGITVPWWDWGTREEYLVNAEYITFPYHMGSYDRIEFYEAFHQETNGGRPKILVPASNEIEFTVVE